LHRPRLAEYNSVDMPEQVGLSYKQHPPSGEFEAIVIGSGMGGLAAAAFLAKHGGRRVLVLERHYTAGGYTHVFRSETPESFAANLDRSQ